MPETNKDPMTICATCPYRKECLQPDGPRFIGPSCNDESFDRR